MKNSTLNPMYVLFILICIFAVSCQELKVQDPLTVVFNKAVSIEQAKQLINTKGLNGKSPIWELAETVKRNNITYLDIPVIYDLNLTPAIPNNTGNVNEEIMRLTRNELTHLLVYEDKSGAIQTEVLTYIPDDSFYENLKSIKRTNGQVKFSGIATLKSWEDKHIAAYRVKENRITGELTYTTPSEKARSTADACGSTQWLRCVCNMGPTGYAQCNCTVYGMDYYGCLYYPNPSTGGNNNLITYTNGGGTLFAVSSDGGINSQVANGNYITYPVDPGDSNISAQAALNCFGSASNTDNYNYFITVYVDEPIPNSGKSFGLASGVGHAWIGFQRIDKTTNSSTNTAIGLYPSYASINGIRAGVPSQVKENSTHPADVSITYAVDKNQFNNAVTGALFYSNRSYSLENYNCTDYVYSICDYAGLVIPKPYSNFYVWDGSNNAVIQLHSPGALGAALRTINSNAVKTNQNAPARNANCN